MFNVFVNDGTQEMPEDDILYIVCKEGTYLRKRLGIMESITPVDNISILNSVEMMATMHIKPIPGTLFAPVIDFFNKVYEEHHAEAIVLLFYNEAKRTYRVVAPAQKVSGAGVDYNRAMTVEDHIMVGDIHSHANFSAFHSGIDDADEKSFDGLHITIGNNGDEEVSISTSIVSNGQRFIANTLDYVHGLKLTVDVDEEVEEPVVQYHVYDYQLKKLVPRTGLKTKTVRKYDKRFLSTVSKKYKKCPDEWMENVEKQAYTYVSKHYGTAQWKNWNTNNFDKNAWKDYKNPPATNITKQVMFPPHDQTPYTTDVKKVIPCESCTFRDSMVEWAFEQIMEKELADDTPDMSRYLDDEGNPIDWYQCEQCKAIFSTIEDMPVCQTCNVDDYLILLDPEDLEFEDVAIPDTAPIDVPEWYQCNRCKAVIEMETTPVCNICKKDDMLVQLHLEGPPTPYVPNNITEETTFNYKCKECASEMDVLNHGQCPYCGGDVMDVIDMQALQAANEADEIEATPLQVPDEDKIPLGTRRKRKKPGVLASLFNRRNHKS